MSKKITSNHLKAALLANFRFAKHYPIITTEVGAFKADVIAIDPTKNKFVEVEVKISKSDLLKDLKKPKHDFYKKNQGGYIPHQFYYCVPTELIDIALKMVKELPYGVIRYRGLRKGRNATQDGVIIVKRAKNLHNNNNKIQDYVINDFIKRMSSEVANYAIKEVLNV